MRCPSCRAPGSQVTNSRPRDDDQSVYRRRGCPACGHRFTTYEAAEVQSPGALEAWAEVMTVNTVGHSVRQQDRAKKAAEIVALLSLMPTADIDLLIATATRFADAAADSDLRERAA